MNDSEHPLHFTALVTNYNYGRFLLEAIESIEKQTYPVSQIIIVDDGSEDESSALLQQLQERIGSRLVVIEQKNAGQAAAINAGVARSTGDIVGMLDADDRWAPTKVATVVRCFSSHANAGMVQHGMEQIDRAGNPLVSKPSQPLPSGDLFPLLVRTGGANVFEPTSGLSFRRSVLDQIVPLPASDWRLCADGALAFGAAVVAEVVSLKDTLADYRLHGENLYVQKPQKKAQLYRDLAMTSDYINEWASRTGKTGRVDLNQQLMYRRDRHYEKGGFQDRLVVLGLIAKWPLYSWGEKIWFGARFIAKSMARRFRHEETETS